MAVTAVVACTGVPPEEQPLPAADANALDAVFSDTFLLSQGDFEAFTAESDPRVLWPLVDLLRFHQESPRAIELQHAIGRVGGLPDDLGWVAVTNALISRDLPAFDGYLDLKRQQFLTIEAGWDPFLDPGADLDYRLVTWGGVFRDGISALNDPAVVGAAQGWIAAGEEVFGVVVGDEARAYPRRVMEVHELVNDTLGGRRISIPYCTLCGSAIAYALDDIEGLQAQRAELRTSGLLLRSNKLMYEASTESLFDQFGGVGLSGPLQGVALSRLPLQATTWEAWTAAHPTTTIVAMDATGRTYDPDPLDGRDDNGPIFPVGDIDDRLDPQARVIAVTTAGGEQIAFEEEAATLAIAAGEDVVVGGARVLSDRGVLTVVDTATGGVLPSGVAFWFAHSQFRPDATLWTGN